MTTKPLYFLRAINETLEPRVTSLLRDLALHLKCVATIRILSGAKLVSLRGSPGRLRLATSAEHSQAAIGPNHK